MGCSEKLLDKGSTKTQRGKFQILYLRVRCQMSKGLGGFFLPDLLSTAHFCLRLVLLQVCSSHWQTSHDRISMQHLQRLQVSNTYVAFTFTALNNGLSGPPCRQAPPVIFLASMDLFNSKKDSTTRLLLHFSCL